MAHCFERIIKGMNLKKEEMVAEHARRLQTAGPAGPGQMPDYGAAPHTQSVHVSDLDLFAPEPTSHLSLRSLTPPLHCHSQTDVIAEDSCGAAVLVRISAELSLPEGTFFTVKEPMLETIGNRVGIVASTDVLVAHRNEDIPEEFNDEYFLALAKKWQQEGNPAKALESSQRGLSRHPSHPALLQIAGECCLSIGLSQLAYETAVKALLLAPSHTPFRFILAEALLAMGRVEEAEGQMELARRGAHNEVQLAALKSAIDRRKLAVREEAAVKEECRQRIQKELVLVEWPRLVSPEKVKKLMDDYGIPVSRVALRGKIAILAYDSVEARESARRRLLELDDCEFMLANEPAPRVYSP